MKNLLTILYQIYVGLKYPPFFWGGDDLTNNTLSKTIVLTIIIMTITIMPSIKLIINMIV